MTEESARRLAELLYSPFLTNGLIDQKSVDMATQMILNHVEIERVKDRIAELEATP